MSGLEPLAALGLACNIFQLVEVGCNTIKLAKDIYQSSSPVVDKRLEDNAVVLSTIGGEVKAAQRPASLSKIDKQLVSTADKCFSSARDLQEEVRFLLSNAKQNQLVATLKVVAKTTWRKRRLDRLKESLEGAESLMRTTLLAQIWSRTRAAELDLSNIKDDLCAFIQEYQSRTTDLKQLVSSESLMTRKHISVSSKEALDAIGGIEKQVNRLTVKADVQITQTERDRLLRSLKFPAFNERRNQVSEAHESTFEWIFLGDDGPSQEDVAQSDLEDLGLADPREASWDLFSNWLSSTANIYWISGKPGSGKTTLVKYVLDHPRTATYLNTWSPQTLIISHFFWRPGTPMQQSSKGLLCSLLYQLVDNSVTATDHVLQDIQTRRSGKKDADTDWSERELRSIFLKVLSSYERPICIFIDGLDEVNPTDGSIKLLDLVEEFSRCRNAKLCLSSRPEAILEKRLSVFPHLRVQNLTRPDLERYARDHIRVAGSIRGEALSNWSMVNKDPIKLLVDKAEGVFLWLVLATKSINKGFTQGDTSAMIRQRIDSLPGDLTRLYKDMWNRACEDNPVAYRQIAARYFRLILLSQRTHWKLGSVVESSLLHLMLASTAVADQLLDAIDNPHGLVPAKRLLENCRAVEQRLELYCFGLIEIFQSSGEDGVVGWYGSQYNTLWPLYGRRQLRFIHRTAQDFLLDTVDGAEILSHDSTTEASLFFAWTRAHLAISQIFATAGSLEEGDSSLISDYEFLFDQFLLKSPCSGHPDQIRTISYVRKLCSSGQLLSYMDGELRFCGDENFFMAAAGILDESLLSRAEISTLSKSTLSEILLNFCRHTHSWLYSRPSKYQPERMLMTLLYEGADPNWRGCTFTSPFSDMSTFLDVQTLFTRYLDTMIKVDRLLSLPSDVPSFEPYPIVKLFGNLHLLLSHAANLEDPMYRVFPYNTSGEITDSGGIEILCVNEAIN